MSGSAGGTLEHRKITSRRITAPHRSTSPPVSRSGIGFPTPGNRRLNHALHMMAVTQIRQPDTIGRRYYERKRLEGKTPRRRCAA
jgi:transposase